MTRWSCTCRICPITRPSSSAYDSVERTHVNWLRQEKTMTGNNYSRRELLKGMGYAALAAGACWTEPSLFGWTVPTAPVAIAKCKTYDRGELVATLDRMFDQL